MGNVQTNLTRQTITAFTEYLNTNITQITNNARANCVAGNILTLNIGGPNCPSAATLPFEGIDLGIDQRALANCQLNAQFVSQLNTQIENQIENIVKNFIEQDLKNNQGFFALAFSGQANIAESTTQVSNRIANYVKSNIDTFCGATSIATNEQTINLCQPVLYSKIRLNQDASATAYVNCVSNTIVDAFIKDGALNELASKATQTAASKQEGLGSILIYIIIAAAIIAVIAIIGLIIYLVMSSRSSGGATTVNMPPQIATLAMI